MQRLAQITDSWLSLQPPSSCLVEKLLQCILASLQTCSIEVCHDSSIQTADAITIDQRNDHHNRKQNGWQLVITIAGITMMGEILMLISVTCLEKVKKGPAYQDLEEHESITVAEYHDRCWMLYSLNTGTGSLTVDCYW